MTSTFEIDVPTLKARITNILKTPNTEWPVIEMETTTTEKLYKSYIAPLAAIPAVANFIGVTVIGVTLPFIGTVRYGILGAFVSMVVSYLLSLAGVYVAALVIDKLASTFESRSDQLQALKLVAYAQTPVWIAGVLLVIPALGLLTIFAVFYAVYLFYVGLPVMMKTPQAKVIPYMVVSAIVIVAVWVLVALVTGAVTGVPRY